MLVGIRSVGDDPTALGVGAMDFATLVVLAGAAIIGALASWAILSRRETPEESPFAASTEGVTRCPNCGLANDVTDTTCANCGATLPS